MLLMLSDSSVERMKNIDVRKCQYDWAVPQYCYDLVQSSTFYDKVDSFNWYLTFQLWSKASGTGLIGECNLIINSEQSACDIQSHGAYGGQVVLVFVSENRELLVDEGTLKAWNVDDQQLNQSHIVYNRNFEIEELFFANHLSVKCEITFFKLDDAIPLFISELQSPVIPFEVSVSNPLEDFGKLFLNEEHSDVVISLDGKNEKMTEHPAHKVVLIARSSVFEAMFKHDMKEKKRNRIVIEDIEENVFLEALRYMYTGNVQNLDTLVYDLLPVADKYDLEKLRVMCGNILRKKLSVETAVKIVSLADMYNVGDLKNTATQFIKEHSADVVKKMDSEAWQDLMSRPHLMKDLLVVNMNK